jgi:hypothetical protein
MVRAILAGINRDFRRIEGNLDAVCDNHREKDDHPAIAGGFFAI